MRSLLRKARDLVLGKPLDPEDPSIFHRLSLIAFFAWVGLGSDGLSSSCYGPEEAFLALGNHQHLGIFVVLCTVVTIAVISMSYSQIIELFPGGGGGYLVATRLLSPAVGMVSGCALLIDYVLTITISIASGADAVFSFLPVAWLPFKLWVAVGGVLILTLLNLRGVKESVVPLVPIFLLFLAMHLIVIGYSFATHLADFGAVASETSREMGNSHAQLGWLGVMLLILRSYSMGAGTFTGIEAVSNGIPILRDPKVETAKHTMRYMATSLSVMVVGLMLSYLLFGVSHTPGRTLNAVLVNAMTGGWDRGLARAFVLVTLISEAVLLFVAAQTGFLDGPRVLANMAIDRWMPNRFSMLNDRLVTKNGILIMSAAALALMVLSKGSVRFLVVLYSINVFITFVLSQLGMVRHWIMARGTERGWLRKLLINGTGLALTSFILLSVVMLKFGEGGWITVLVTGSLIVLVVYIRRHYDRTGMMLKRLDSLRDDALAVMEATEAKGRRPRRGRRFDAGDKTAVLLVNGFTGLGIHSLLKVFGMFGDSFRNYVFLQVGVVDASTLKSHEEVEGMLGRINEGLELYVRYVRSLGFHGEHRSSLAIDVVEEVATIAPEIQRRYPRSVFFGGQLVFPQESFLTRLLHNYTAFASQKRLYNIGIPFVLLPAKLQDDGKSP
ncbi:MAG: APC family permease [Spirochaetes bacterium]|nr:APC family permease [Spirochaetota bacterium]